tara:strand:+ start:471 stop:695 length:225 start_codon:yes stop_codon:yes gene_type:complete
MTMTAPSLQGDARQSALYLRFKAYERKWRGRLDRLWDGAWVEFVEDAVQAGIMPSVVVGWVQRHPTTLGDNSEN